MILQSQSGITLRSLVTGDAPAVLSILNIDRALFDPWVRWSSVVTTVEEAEAFIAAAAERERAGNGFHLGIWHDTELLGGVVCWWIEASTHVAEIGYWLAPTARGQGVAFGASTAAISHLFDSCEVRVVELQCLVDNQASRSLAERLGGTLESIRRQQCGAHGPLRDTAVYVIKRK